MDAEIDSGQILECRRFKIDKADTLPELWMKTNNNTLSLALDFIDGIFNDGDKFIQFKKMKPSQRNGLEN